MKKIWEFFENMDELVYVSDIENYDLIYMNKKSRDTYGFHSLEEMSGKKCYEVLQNCSTPCSICNNHELKEGYDFERYRRRRERQKIQDRVSGRPGETGAAGQYAAKLSES